MVQEKTKKKSNDEAKNIIVNQIHKTKSEKVQKVKFNKNNIEQNKEKNKEEEITFEEEINRIKQKNIDIGKLSEENELKIELFPENIPQGILKKEPLIQKLPKDMLGLSLNKEKSLTFFGANIPLLEGFYSSPYNHYPIRIKPDDI